MRLIADIYTTFNTRADTRRAEGTEMGLHISSHISGAERRALYDARHSRMFEGLFSQLYRMRSQKNVTFISAVFAIEAYKTHAAHSLTDALGFFFRGVLQSQE